MTVEVNGQSDQGAAQTPEQQGQQQQAPANQQQAQEPAQVIDPKLDAQQQQPTQTPAQSEAPAGDAPIEYEPTGYPGLDVALGFVGKLGIGLDHPAMQATSTGDFSLIKAHLATMGDKAQGWEQMVALAEEAYQQNETKKTETAQKVSAAVISVAGSPEAWNEMKAWAQANADQAEKDAINAMFDAGPIQARMAAMYIAEAYRKAPGNTVKPNSALRQTAGAGQAVNSNAPLTPGEYAAAVRDLRGKLGNRMDASPEYAALRARLRR